MEAQFALVRPLLTCLYLQRIVSLEARVSTMQQTWLTKIGA